MLFPPEREEALRWEAGRRESHHSATAPGHPRSLHVAVYLRKGRQPIARDFRDTRYPPALEGGCACLRTPAPRSWASSPSDYLSMTVYMKYPLNVRTEARSASCDEVTVL